MSAFIRPLAERLRPKSLDEVVGQEHITGREGIIALSIARKKPLSLLLYGPPGTGKTTIARLYAKAFDLPFQSMSAIFSGVADLKKILQQGQDNPLFARQTVLFVDEIHRFNKMQQDAFLPFIEEGSLILIGATTENPAFALNQALLSRLRLLKLKGLDEPSLSNIIARYEKEKPLPIEAEAKDFLIHRAQGDGRYLLNLIENIEQSAATSESPLSKAALEQLIQQRAPLFDRQGDHHYTLISALHKSIRGSDPEATLYWLSRMLNGGEDPLYIARRLIRVAIEDIGLADKDALQLALNAEKVYRLLGSPEGELALAEAAVYLALAPKSNRLYQAFGLARQLAEATSHLAPPSFLHPHKLTRDQPDAEYLYDHDAPDSFSGQNYFPEKMPRPNLYQPKEIGFERELKKRILYFESLRQRR
ncbi:MAG: rarA [Chlamydiales bacterium]|jgi:putative ATPase|nr:rarA [Chlamydiales bacterium]